MQRLKRWFRFWLPLPALVLGCAGSLESGRLSAYAAKPSLGSAPAAALAGDRDAVRCASLDGQRRTWGALAKGTAMLGGASGIATFPVDRERYEHALIVSSAVLAAFSAAAFYVSESAGDRWSAECLP